MVLGWGIGDFTQYCKQGDELLSVPWIDKRMVNTSVHKTYMGDLHPNPVTVTTT